MSLPPLRAGGPDRGRPQYLSLAVSQRAPTVGVTNEEKTMDKLERVESAWRAFARLRILCVFALVVGVAAQAAADETFERRTEWEHRWALLGTNMLVDDRATKAGEIVERAAAAGYTGVVFADSKTTTWFNPDFSMPKWERNATHLREKARRLGLGFWVHVMPFGSAGGILSHDVNLATGYPVRNARLQAKNGRLVPVRSASIPNASFEAHDGSRFDGWFHDDPGLGSFVDTDVVKDGATSIRFEGTRDANEYGHARASQTIQVEPYQQYRVRVWMRSADLSGWFAVMVKGIGQDRDLQTLSETLRSHTTEWTEYVTTFNSVDFHEVKLYAGIWGGTGGKLWLDTLSIEPVPTLNVLRRETLPLVVAAEDGHPYQEGRDYRPVRDPKLGRSAWIGSYDSLHAPPTIELSDDTRIREGELVTLSCYHALLMPGEQITASMADPKVYDICAAQVRNAQLLLEPDGYFLGHDEIRTGGWEPDATNRFSTSGELFAHNIGRCYEIAVDEGHARPVCVWSDMFDPHHNAHANYYMVNNDLSGSWEGMPRDLIVVEWLPQRESVEFFAGRGHRQIVAGYYDEDVAQNYEAWMAAIQGSDGVIGTMYCTWRDGWEDLERYAEVWWGGEKRR